MYKYTSLFSDKSLKKCKIYKDTQSKWTVNLYDIFDIYIETIYRTKQINDVIDSVTREVFVETFFQEFRLALSNYGETFEYRYTDGCFNDDSLISRLNEISNLNKCFVDVYDVEYIVFVLTHVNIWVCSSVSSIEKHDLLNVSVGIYPHYNCSLYSLNFDTIDSISKCMDNDIYIKLSYNRQFIMYHLNVPKLSTLNEPCISESRSYKLSIDLNKLIKRKSDRKNKKLLNLQTKYDLLYNYTILRDSFIFIMILLICIYRYFM